MAQRRLVDGPADAERISRILAGDLDASAARCRASPCAAVAVHADGLALRLVIARRRRHWKRCLKQAMAAHTKPEARATQDKRRNERGPRDVLNDPRDAGGRE